MDARFSRKGATMANSHDVMRKMNEALINGGCIAISAKDAPNITMDCDHFRGVVSFSGRFEDFAIINRPTPALPKIERVIFNPPATIVFWSDKTKTVVKCSECQSAGGHEACADYVRRSLCKTPCGSWLQRTCDWAWSGLLAAMLKKAWGSAAPSMIAEALAAADWNGGADD